jgi:hypothetical protein
VGNLCLPIKFDDIVDVIDKSALMQALYNIQVIGSINGVSFDG